MNNLNNMVAQEHESMVGQVNEHLKDSVKKTARLEQEVATLRRENQDLRTQLTAPKGIINPKARGSKESVVSFVLADSVDEETRFVVSAAPPDEAPPPIAVAVQQGPVKLGAEVEPVASGSGGDSPSSLLAAFAPLDDRGGVGAPSRVNKPGQEPR